MRINMRWEYEDEYGTIQTCQFSGLHFKVHLYAENYWCLKVDGIPTGVYKSVEGAKRAARRIINKKEVF